MGLRPWVLQLWRMEGCAPRLPEAARDLLLQLVCQLAVEGHGGPKLL